MVKTVITASLICLGLSAVSQQGVTTTTTFVVSKDTAVSQTRETLLSYKSVEEALGLPSVYKVITCSFIFSTKGQIFKTEAPWSSVVAFISSAKQGDALTIDNIIVSRDGKRSKLVSKTFKF